MHPMRLVRYACEEPSASLDLPDMFGHAARRSSTCITPPFTLSRMYASLLRAVLRLHRHMHVHVHVYTVVGGVVVGC